jgi:Tol biopolymer transport system component
LDRTGRAVSTLAQPDDAQLTLSRLSSDGSTVSVTRTVGGANSVWLLDVKRGVLRRLTFAANERMPIFSPDGTRVVYGIDGDSEASDIYERASDGTQGDTRLLESDDNKHPLDWSPDGRYILYAVTTGRDLWVLPLIGERKPIALTRTPFAERDGRFSPDGKWIAYTTNETGRDEIHVQPFPGPGPSVQVSVGGGDSPRWRRDGRELFFLAPDKRLMAVSISDVGARLDAQSPRALFKLSTTSTYEPSTDGQRFLVTAIVSEASPITVILNWKPPAQ